MTSYDKQEGTDRPLHDASLREVQLASTTQAHALGGGSVSTETANNPVGQHELAEWYPGLSFTADASAPQLAGGFTPQVGRSTPVTSPSTVASQWAASLN